MDVKQHLELYGYSTDERQTYASEGYDPMSSMPLKSKILQSTLDCKTRSSWADLSEDVQIANADELDMMPLCATRQSNHRPRKEPQPRILDAWLQQPLKVSRKRRAKS